MKLFKTVLVIALVHAGTILQAQTADEIINKHIDAIGGKAIITKIKSLVTNADLSVMGSTLSSTTSILVGKGFKNVANFNGQEIIQCVTPTAGWMINPLAGATDPQPLPDDQVKAAQSAFDVGGELFEYKSKGSKVELMGRETIEGINTHKLKITNKDGKDAYYFIDPTTFYIIKREATTNINGADVTATSLFSNYKKTDFGYVLPYTTVSNQGFEITINLTKVEFNKEIDPKIFDMPKS